MESERCGYVIYGLGPIQKIMFMRKVSFEMQRARLEWQKVLEGVKLGSCKDSKISFAQSSRGKEQRSGEGCQSNFPKFTVYWVKDKIGMKLYSIPNTFETSYRNNRSDTWFCLCTKEYRG